MTLLEAVDRFLVEASRAQRQRTRNRLARRLAARLRPAFVAQGEAFLTRMAVYQDLFVVRESITEDNWGPLLDGSWFDAYLRFAEPITTYAGEAIGAGMAQMAASLGTASVGLSFDLANPRATEYLGRVGAERVGGLNDTTHDAMRVLLRQAADEGWSYDKTASAIRDRFADMSRQRATLIAVTEVGDAYSEGNRIVARDMQAAGLAMEKRWLTSRDERVTQGCRDNATAGWIDLEQPFPSGHQRPLRFPRCRCDTEFRRKVEAV